MFDKYIETSIAICPAIRMEVVIVDCSSMAMRMVRVRYLLVVLVWVIKVIKLEKRAATSSLGIENWVNFNLGHFKFLSIYKNV